MKKQDVISYVAEAMDLPKNKTGEVLDTLLKLIVDKVAAGEKVEFFGFGNFEVSKRAARNGINPQTKKPIKIAAKNAVKFKPAKAFKDAVN